VTSNVRPWAPSGCTSDPRIRAKAERAVEAWSTRWFAQRQIVISGWRAAPAPERLAATDGPWLTTRAVVAVWCPARGQARLVGWALDTNLEQHAPTDADQRVLKAFVALIVEDLAKEFEEALAFAQAREAAMAAKDEAQMIVDLTDANGLKLLSLAMPLAGLVTLRKALAGAPANARGGLTPILTAAAAAKVTLDVVLGAARAGLAEVGNLAEGDVLILATPLAGEVQLAASTGAVARARLVEHEGRRALALQSIVKERV
jgi:flagellar motor switch/type III secretory pathway protein FliN